MSKSPQFYFTKTKKELYEVLLKGIPLQSGKVWFSLGSNGERNEMISATKFSYKNRLTHKWRSVTESRFQKVAEMLDVSNMKIHIKIRTQFLSPGVYYKVNLVFKFCGPRKSQTKRMYVNLKYKKGNENLNAYFATWRDDEWMTIELGRFLNHKEDADFDILLESFARCYCESRSIHIEGIEFQAIDNVKDINVIGRLNAFYDKKSEDGSKSGDMGENQAECWISKMKRKKEHVLKKVDEKKDRLISKVKKKKDGLLNKTCKKKGVMVSAKDVLYDDYTCRFQKVIEKLSPQVFRIKFKTESHKLVENTINVCYLVFKLSEKCRGLHCPIIVQNLLQRKNKETRILYFRNPSPWNLHDTDWVPREREDGSMEVIVWKFISANELKKDSLSVYLKLICYEGTISGLHISGLHFTSM